MLLLAAGLATGACGGGGDKSSDDDNTDTDKNTESDAKVGTGGGKDAATSGPITTIGDAGASELADALDEEGVHVSARRIALVFQASCQRAKECDDPEWSTTCESDGEDAFNSGVTDLGIDEACQDATLDRVACYATVSTCESYYNDGCTKFEDSSEAACGKYETDGGMF